MAEIQLKGVTKRYPDGTEAVKAMDLDVGDGEFMILVGPSGCGKSITSTSRPMPTSRTSSQSWPRTPA